MHGSVCANTFSDLVPSDDTIACIVLSHITAALPGRDPRLYSVVYTPGGLVGTI